MFRGPHGDGITEETGFPFEWSTEKNPLETEAAESRQRESIGPNGRVFVTSATGEGDRSGGRTVWIERRATCCGRKLFRLRVTSRRIRRIPLVRRDASRDW